MILIDLREFSSSLCETVTVRPGSVTGDTRTHGLMPQEKGKRGREKVGRWVYKQNSHSEIREKINL